MGKVGKRLGLRVAQTGKRKRTEREQQFLCQDSSFSSDIRQQSGGVSTPNLQLPFSAGRTQFLKGSGSEARRPGKQSVRILRQRRGRCQFICNELLLAPFVLHRLS